MWQGIKDLLKLQETTVLVILALLVSIFVIASVLNWYFPGMSMKWKGPVLFVTAHPDDECMFFAPSVINSLENSCNENVYLLCLTNGNYYGLGHIRKKEILKSCVALGMSVKNVFVLDSVFFLDGNTDWDFQRVRVAIKEKVIELGIKTIVTFDSHGVSKHLNHIALFQSLSEIIQKSGINQIKLYTLQSVNIFRKYISVLDLIFSIIDCYIAKLFHSSSKHLVILNLSQIWKPQEAMLHHRTQYIWFRKLYVIFSRYMILNTLKFEGTLDM